MVLERVSAAGPVSPVWTASIGNSATMAPAGITAPSLQFSTNFRLENTEDPSAILQDWKSNRGGLYGDGFFGKSSIDVKDALKKLNKGDAVYVKDRFGGYDKLKSQDDLFLLNSLEGPAADHHRADPSLRLPLLFLSGQKLTTDDRKEKISSYRAYKRLQGNQAVKLNDQPISAAVLARKVIDSFLPADIDPNRALLASVAISGNDGGWKVDGRDVSGDVLYLALLKGADRVTFQGTPVAGRDGLHLVNFLLHGQEGDRLPPNLQAAAGEYRSHLSHLPAPDRDPYSAFNFLQANQAVRFGSDTVRSLAELAILDALQGDKQPAPALNPDIQRALIALSDGGLSSGGPFATYQALAAGQPVSYTFRGGPTNEPIALTIPSLDAAVAVNQQVEAQRQQDRFRPDLDTFKRLMAEKGSAFGAILDGNLSASRAARAAAQADIPRQEDIIRSAQARYDDNARRLQDVNGRIGPAQDQERRAERDLETARSRYDSDRREFDRLTERYNWTSWEIDRLQRLAAEEDRLAAEEDRLANQPPPQPPTPPPGGGHRNPPPGSVPPDDRELHRQRAAEHRRRAQEYRNQANWRNTELIQIRWDLDRARRELDRSQRDLYDAQADYDRAVGNLRALQNEASGYQAQMNAARRDIDGANAAINRDRQTIQDADTILGIGSSLQASLNHLLGTAQAVRNFEDYEAHRAELNGDALQLATLSANETFRKVHGDALATGLVPIQALLASMDKPPQETGGHRVRYQPVLPKDK